MPERDRDAFPGAVRKRLGVFIGAVMRVDDESLDPCSAQMLHRVCDDWPPADRQKRLGCVFGERPEPYSQSRAQDKGGVNFSVFRIKKIDVHADYSAGLCIKVKTIVQTVA